MKTLLFGLLLGALPAMAGGQPVRAAEVTLYEKFEQSAPASVINALREEVEETMRPMGFSLSWRQLSTVQGNEVVTELVVVTYHGRCDATGLMPRSIVPQALGWTHVSDGVILPFSEVDCDRVRNFLQKDLAGEPVAERDALFGRALGRILSHELYHVLAQTSHHVSCGVAKSSFSVADLLTDEFEFEKVEPARFHRAASKNETSPEFGGASAIIPSSEAR